jgi:hypothetical protein
VRVAMASIAAYAGRVNEDFAGAVPGAVVLLDGAGGVDGSETVCRHGVAWFAHRLGGQLLGLLALGPERALAAVLAEAIDQVAHAHRGTCDVADPRSPWAAVAMLRLRADGRADYLVLGDPVLVLDRHPAAADGQDRTATLDSDSQAHRATAGGEHRAHPAAADGAHRAGGPLVVTDVREAEIGRPYRSALAGLAEGGAGYEDARREAIAGLRSRRNQAGGYWVAKDDPRAAAEAIAGECPRAGLRGAVLLSNGASRIVDRFALAGWPRVLADLDAHGPAAIIDRVRRAEARSSVPPDDATIAYCTGLHP